MSKLRWTLTLALVAVATLALSPTALAQVDSVLLGGMEARSIGPAGMSGRIAAIDVVIDDPDTIYVGAATGGVWKSTDGGVTWEPIFDDQPVAAIGAIAINQGAPDIVWVGTGEGNPRNSVSVGNGIYKSMDGGRTWTHLGLENTERIHKIRLHPDDPNVAWVAAMGQMWGENEERGVYKTTDGGLTWDRVLYVDERTGAADLVIDPRNPNKLFAAMWEYRRWPFFFKSGGPGSGLYRSHDGGATWTQLTDREGMPEGELGRIGVAIAPSDPSVVYAIVEADSNVVLRSDDGGFRFRTVNDDTDASPRPFYYSDLRVDPERPDRVYRVASRVHVSNDGGQTFEGLGGRATHPDHHAFWIHPEDPTFIVNGNDGGVYISRDRGDTWNFVRNLPLAQFYHVAVDMETPYNVYGGLQDNGSWRGPGSVRSGGFFGGGIDNSKWTMVSFGDGFDTRASQDDAEEGYSMSQGGNLVRWNLRTGESRDLKPDAPDEEPLRFNWNAGLALDPFSDDTIYYGSQYVHRSTDRGENWTIISPDLTTDEEEWQQQADSGGLTLDVTAAENYTTVIAIEPSPLQEGLLWVGTDDGRLHVTRDGGDSWESLEDNVPGVPANTWIPHIDASPHDPATAFVVFDDHRRSNLTPYVYRTDDYGQTWTSLVTDEIRGYALRVVQDLVDPDLLFLGTEFGLWVSFDGGASWTPWRHGVPTVSVMDMVIHPREHDLVLGTHGRAIFILDDIRPLREVGDGALEAPVHLFQMPDAWQYGSQQMSGELFGGNAAFLGENRPYGAMITFALADPELPTHDELPEAPAGAGGPMAAFFGGGGGGDRGDDRPTASLEILDAAGETIRTMQVPVARGINRTVWNLRRDPFYRPQGGGFGGFGGGLGPEVLPGTYTVRVKYGEESAEGTLVVHADPDSPFSIADREAKLEVMRQVGEMQRVAGEAISRITDTRREVQDIVRRARSAGGPAGPGRGGAGTAGAAEQAGEAAAEGAEGQEEAAAAVPPSRTLADKGRELTTRLDELEKMFRTPPDTKGITASDHINSKIGDAMGRLNSTMGPVSDSDRVYIRQAREALAGGLDAVNAVFAEQVAEFRRLTREAGIELLPEVEPLALPAQ